jgi:single-stranded-DNA-specific exonuclease
MRWIRPSVNEGQANHIARQFGISPVVGSLLAGRGLIEESDIEAFLTPRLKDVSDPLLLGGMTDAVNRLEKALKRQESILIFGDYDVDGVTSTVFLIQFLRQFGCSPRFAVPKRLEEGYGLSRESLSRAMEHGKPDLLIAVDCGTSSADEVAWLREQDISVIILDHHTSKESLPTDCVLVNPHVKDDDDVSWKHMCSVGLVFKFCHAFLKIMREQGDPFALQTDLREFLDLVAMGTVADLVTLEGENRILVKHGLQRLKSCQRPGVCALMEVAGVSLGEEITPFDIGFKLGPRINASGRLDDASIPIHLLLGEDWSSCTEVARQLDSYNRDRQDIERAITLEAEALVESSFSDSPGLVLHSPDWHAGVVGIVASRISRKFNRPTLVLGADSDGQLKGSGRSIESVDLVQVLQSCESHLVQWGGHPMAVGLTIESDKVENLRIAFEAAIRNQFPDGLPEPALSIDAELKPDDLRVSLLSELEILAPYGQGNPEPVFLLRQIQLASSSLLAREHVRFSMYIPASNGPIDGVGWNMAENAPPAGSPIDMVVRFHWHSWRGRRNPRLTMLDWR